MSVAPHPAQPDSNRHMLRHALATLAYRGAKTLRGVTEEFSRFRATESCRTPGQLVAHLSDLLNWSLSQAKGESKWEESQVLPWEEGKQRFFASLQALDNYLASDAPLKFPAEKLFQGPIADALTHVGQIAILRRIAGVPIKGENYVMAEIAVGRVGEDQAPPRREF